MQDTWIIVNNVLRYAAGVQENAVESQPKQQRHILLKEIENYSAILLFIFFTCLYIMDIIQIQGSANGVYI